MATTDPHSAPEDIAPSGDIVKCADCGKIPWPISHDGDLALRCDCDTIIRICPMAKRSVIPETWGD